MGTKPCPHLARHSLNLLDARGDDHVGCKYLPPATVLVCVSPGTRRQGLWAGLTQATAAEPGPRTSAPPRSAGADSTDGTDNGDNGASSAVRAGDGRHVRRSNESQSHYAERSRTKRRPKHCTVLFIHSSRKRKRIYCDGEQISGSLGVGDAGRGHRGAEGSFRDGGDQHDPDRGDGVWVWTGHYSPHCTNMYSLAFTSLRWLERKPEKAARCGPGSQVSTWAVTPAIF